jgi:hypothetical protein
MRNKITIAFILGGLFGAAVATAVNVASPTVCRKVVLHDMARAAQFQTQLAEYVGGQDFLTTLTKGK